MSEKRFKKMDTIIDPFPIWDTVEEKGYNCTDTLDLLVDLLNEQQTTIQSLKSDKAIAEDYANIFEKENVKLRKQIGEQQATIRKLQDLCGKSDYENAKLRLKNKELQDKIDWLCERYGYNGDGV